MNNPINNSVFDTRDLIKYKEFLESILVDIWNDYLLEIEDGDGTAEIEDISEVDFNLEGFANRFADDVGEYKSIEAFCNDLDGSPDFIYGESVIHENYFTEYCEDLLKDCGYIPQDFPSWIELDFEATADNMKVDYMSATYEGDTYYIRA